MVGGGAAPSRSEIAYLRGDWAGSAGARHTSARACDQSGLNRSRAAPETGQCEAMNRRAPGRMSAMTAVSQGLLLLSFQKWNYQSM